MLDRLETWQCHTWGPRSFPGHGPRGAAGNIASRSDLVYVMNRATLVSQGLTKSQMLGRVRAQVAAHQLPAPEPDAMSYTLSKRQYFGTDAGQ
jgi:hypothetical protein